MRPMHWVRLWTTLLDPDGSWSRLTLAQRGLFATLLALAGKANQGGEISIPGLPGVAYEPAQLAAACRVSQEELDAVLPGLLVEAVERKPNGCLHLRNWGKYQTEYERQKGYRQRLQAKVTQQKQNQKSEDQKPEEQKQKRTGEPAAADSPGDNYVANSMNWFHSRYAAIVGHDSPDKPCDGRIHPAERRAAQKLHRLLEAGTYTPQALDTLLRDWLRGCYYSSPAGKLSTFVACLGKLTPPNRKPTGGVLPDKKPERRRTSGGPTSIGDAIANVVKRLEDDNG